MKMLDDVSSAKAFFKELVGLSFFDVIKCTYEPGAKDSKLVVVTGENATGKSFVRRIVNAALHQHKIEFIALSMQLRTEVGNISKSFIYGDESNSSTGDISGRTVTTAINTSLAREKEGRRHAIAWDEPDVGLSDNYAAGAAEEILEYTANPPKNLLFAIVTTHRRSMLERLAKGKPHHLRLGDELTLDEFLGSPITPKKLSELSDRSLETFRLISKEFKL